MIQIQTKLSKGYQLTLPSAIRKAMSLEVENPITLTYDKGTLTLQKAETPAEKIQRIFRELDELRKEHEKTITPEQRAFTEKSRDWTANQYHEYIDNLPETIAHRKEKYGI